VVAVTPELHYEETGKVDLTLVLYDTNATGTGIVCLDPLWHRFLGAQGVGVGTDVDGYSLRS
jgi:hypothetical protein